MTNQSKEDDQKDDASRPVRVGRRDEDAEKDTEKDGENGVKRSRAGAGAPSVPVPVAMERAHAEMSSAATVGLLLGHGASLTASTNATHLRRGRAIRPRLRRRPRRARRTRRSTPWIITRPQPPSRRLRAVREPVTLAFPATPR
jgi:hypothetical protein